MKLLFNISLFILAFAVASAGSAAKPQPKKAADNTKKEAPEKSELVNIKKEDLQKIQNRMEKLQHLTVKFEQLVYTPLRKKTIPYSGKAQFSRPARFKWQQQTPLKKEVIYNGKDLYMYMPDQKVAQKFSALGAQAKEIEKLAGMVLSINSLLELYKLQDSKYDTVKKVAYLTLTPKVKSEIEGVKIEVNTLKDYVKMVQLTYKDGKVITYKFSQPKRLEIDQSTYTFQKPKGVKLEVFD